MKNRLIFPAGLLLMWALVVPSDGLSQEKPQGRFLQDSIIIGGHATYSIVYKHHNQEVVFPDSSYNFYPFEFVRKEFFPTRTVGSFTIDSAIYYLTTFELDSIQPLGLPVFVLSNGESNAVFAVRDSIYLKETVLVLPDSIDLKDTSHYRKIQTAVNYPYILIGVVGALLVLGMVIGVFGKGIGRKYKLYKLKKEHQKFIQRVDSMIEQMNGNPSQHAGMIVFEWKKYLELLEKQPFTKLTTKEIIRIDPNKSLEKTLKLLDKSLYGNVKDDHVKDWIFNLMDYSYDRYKKKVEEVKHGQ